MVDSMLILNSPTIIENHPSFLKILFSLVESIQKKKKKKKKKKKNQKLINSFFSFLLKPRKKERVGYTTIFKTNG